MVARFLPAGGKSSGERRHRLRSPASVGCSLGTDRDTDVPPIRGVAVRLSCDWWRASAQMSVHDLKRSGRAARRLGDGTVRPPPPNCPHASRYRVRAGAGPAVDSSRIRAPAGDPVKPIALTDDELTALLDLTTRSRRGPDGHGLEPVPAGDQRVPPADPRCAAHTGRTSN